MAFNHSYSYDHARDGDLVEGTLASPWYDVQGLTCVYLEGSGFTGGTTEVFIDFSDDALTVDSSSADQFADIDTGIRVQFPSRYARVRLVQTTADATAGFVGARFEKLAGHDSDGNPFFASSNVLPVGMHV
jgi:hypothetical protein